MIYWVNAHAHDPSGYGGTRHFELARHLAPLGEGVTIISCDLSGRTRDYLRRESSRDKRVISETIEGVPFKWLYTSRYTTNDWRRALSMLRFGWSVVKLLSRAPVDRDTIFVGSSPHLVAAAATYVVARLRRARFVLEVRDLWPETLIDMTGREGLEARIFRVVANHLYRDSQAIIVLAQGSKDRIVELGFQSEKIHYVPNGVDLELFEQIDERASPVLLDPTKATFVYAGAHGPANELRVLVEAAALLQKRGRADVEILLVGDGPSKQDLMSLKDRLGASQVRFHEPIPRNRIPALLAQAAAGVHTLKDAAVFRYGVSPNKVFDYMAAGLPVITNVQGEMARLVDASGCGVHVAPGDPEAMADGIESLLERVRAGEPFGDRGRDYVRRHHNRSQLAVVLAEAFASVRASK